MRVPELISVVTDGLTLLEVADISNKRSSAGKQVSHDKDGRTKVDFDKYEDNSFYLRVLGKMTTKERRSLSQWMETLWSKTDRTMQEKLKKIALRRVRKGRSNAGNTEAEAQSLQFATFMALIAQASFDEGKRLGNEHSNREADSEDQDVSDPWDLIRDYLRGFLELNSDEQYREYLTISAEHETGAEKFLRILEEKWSDRKKTADNDWRQAKGPGGLLTNTKLSLNRATAHRIQGNSTRQLRKNTRRK